MVFCGIPPRRRHWPTARRTEDPGHCVVSPNRRQPFSTARAFSQRNVPRLPKCTTNAAGASTLSPGPPLRVSGSIPPVPAQCGSTPASTGGSVFSSLSLFQSAPPAKRLGTPQSLAHGAMDGRLCRRGHGRLPPRAEQIFLEFACNFRGCRVYYSHTGNRGFGPCLGPEFRSTTRTAGSRPCAYEFTSAAERLGSPFFLLDLPDAGNFSSQRPVQARPSATSYSPDPVSALRPASRPGDRDAIRPVLGAGQPAAQSESDPHQLEGEATVLQPL